MGIELLGRCGLHAVSRQKAASCEDLILIEAGCQIGTSAYPTGPCPHRKTVRFFAKHLYIFDSTGGDCNKQVL